MTESLPDSAFVAESPGIGLYAEKGLHAALKRRYASREGARLEVKLAGKVVDVALPHELVEVQTRNLGSIAEKILSLAAIMPVRVVHPVIRSLVVERVDPLSGELVSTRKSPKKGDLYSVFDELVRASLLVASPNVRLDVVLVDVRETRVRTGKGSWRKKGDEVVSRRLDRVESTLSLDRREDWLALLPPAPEGCYDSASLGAALGIRPERARKILYTYARAGLLAPDGTAGRRKRYRVPADLR